MKTIKLKINAYGKVFTFDSKLICGYIKCDNLKSVIPIFNAACPLMTTKGESFLCDCGTYTDDSPFYHTVYYKGKEVKYGGY
jgi:hypothetical protein